VFEVFPDGSPYILIYYNNMSDKEAEEIRTLPIETGYLTESAFWIGFLQIGESQMEITFDPLRYSKCYGVDFSPEIFRHNQLVTILGISMPTMTLKTYRVATFPIKFLDALHLTFSNFKPYPEYSDIYELFLYERRQLPIEKLWALCEKSGRFGEEE
jgi:hypothetical protein